ncbi:hypothetical protein [Leucobacter aridicollis]|uniref:hypothetical protein n=1 Tax=Leucobacter aridicollis TaxID=283878 RepID=UPI0021689F33|nr:hypothetical protein [Leucobacter aridicollis]MCS3427102.1 putative membrane protein [Leucobacter aridicollis]
MSDEPSRTIMHRFFRAMLLLLGGVIALTLALELIARIWGWIVLVACLSLFIYIAIVGIRWWRDRQR